MCTTGASRRPGVRRVPGPFPPPVPGVCSRREPPPPLEVAAAPGPPVMLDAEESVNEAWSDPADHDAWSSLFWTAFRRSSNQMVLLDAQRRCVDLNDSCLTLLGYARDDLVGVPVWTIVKGGPRASEREWRDAIDQRRFLGETEVVTAAGDVVSMHYAAHAEVVTGRRLVLFVMLDVVRRGRVRQEPAGRPSEALSDREREVVDLVAMGRTGREIAEELHITHNTVRTHVRNAQEKLGARSRAQLVAIALSEGHIFAA